MPKKTERTTPKESASSIKNTNCILYAQSFEDIEEQIKKVMQFFIFDDKQLDVYSNKIADLIIRICCEIESISKDLCRAKEKHKKRHKFDYDCLCSDNDLECVAMYICERTVQVSDENRVIFPFRNMEHRVVQISNTPWNIAYQNLKHDKINSITNYATPRNLFYALGALQALLDRLCKIHSSPTPRKLILAEISGMMIYRPGAQHSIAVAIPERCQDIIKKATDLSE